MWGKGSGIPGTHRWYVPSISCRTIVYKGMLTPGQVGEYYPDLRDPEARLQRLLQAHITG